MNVTKNCDVRSIHRISEMTIGQYPYVYSEYSISACDTIFVLNVIASEQVMCGTDNVIRFVIVYKDA